MLMQNTHTHLISVLDISWDILCSDKKPQVTSCYFYIKKITLKVLASFLDEVHVVVVVVLKL